MTGSTASFCVLATRETQRAKKDARQAQSLWVVNCVAPCLRLCGQWEQDVPGRALQGNHLVGESRSLSGEHSVACGLDGDGLKVLGVLSGQVDGRQEQGQGDGDGVNGGHQGHTDQGAKRAFLLHVDMLTAWASIRKHKGAFWPLVLQMWAARRLSLNQGARSMRVVGELDAATLVGEGEQIGGGVLCHSKNILSQMYISRCADNRDARENVGRRGFRAAGVGFPRKQRNEEESSVRNNRWASQRPVLLAGPPAIQRVRGNVLTHGLIGAHDFNSAASNERSNGSHGSEPGGNQRADDASGQWKLDDDVVVLPNDDMSDRALVNEFLHFVG